MHHSSVRRQYTATPPQVRASERDVALDIDPLSLRVRVEGSDHQFADKIAMEAFLRRLWERTITG